MPKNFQGQAKKTNQRELPLEAAPSDMIRHGLRAAHKRPLVSNGKDADGNYGGSWRCSPRKAWNHAQMQIADAGSSYAAIALDCDNPGGWRLAMADMKLDYGAPPNVVRIRTENDHCHVFYFLRRPVHKYHAARLGPLRKLAQVSEWLQHQYEADPAYTAILQHNPCPRMKVEGFETLFIREEPYTLDELGELIPFGWIAPAIKQSAIGRNVTLFDSLMAWAGKHENRKIDCLAAARLINDEFDDPLTESEVRSTAKSVEKYRAQWEANGWHKPAYIKRKKRNGAKGGKAKTDKPVKGAVKASALDCMTDAKLAKELGVHRNTIRNWKKSGILESKIVHLATQIKTNNLVNKTPLTEQNSVNPESGNAREKIFADRERKLGGTALERAAKLYQPKS